MVDRIETVANSRIDRDAYWLDRQSIGFGVIELHLCQILTGVVQEISQRWPEMMPIRPMQ